MVHRAVHTGVEEDTENRGDVPDLWTLVQSRGWIDQALVIPAMRRTLAEEPPGDYRTELLIHEALNYLQERVGPATLRPQLREHEIARLDHFERECDRGFQSVRSRLMEPTTPDTILQMLRALGERIRQPASISIGGSCSLLLTNMLVRSTDDVAIVDELPEVIRTDHALVDELVKKFGLRPTHFASHHLPNNWAFRARSLGRFGKLDARIVDPIDVIAGKFFSKRTKDFKDIQVCLPNIDMDVLRNRLQHNTTDLRKEERLLEAARHNWYVLTGEEALP